MTARIAPATPPFDPEIAGVIDKTMKGRPPLVLFTTLARDARLAKKFFAGGLLDKGRLTLRQREIVIDRTTALCGSEFEWGVHIAAFAQHVGLNPEQVKATVTGDANDPCWSEEDALLVRFCDALHERCDLDDDMWSQMRERFSEEAILELLLLAGFYRTVSYLTNALRLPLEDSAARFPAR